MARISQPTVREMVARIDTRMEHFEKGLEEFKSEAQKNAGETHAKVDGISSQLTSLIGVEYSNGYREIANSEGGIVGSMRRTLKMHTRALLVAGVGLFVLAFVLTGVVVKMGNPEAGSMFFKILRIIF